MNFNVTRGGGGNVDVVAIRILNISLGPFCRFRKIYLRGKVKKIDKIEK